VLLSVAQHIAVTLSVIEQLPSLVRYFIRLKLSYLNLSLVRLDLHCC